MELLGRGNLCIMAPSEGYTRENDNSPSIVENAEEMLHNALVSANLIERKIPTATITSAVEIKSEPIRPCFEKLMKQQHLRHIEKVALIYELHFTGKIDDEIRQIFHENHAWEPTPEHNYDRAETEQRLTYTMAKAAEGKNYRYRRETLQEQGICFPECPLINCPDCRKPQGNEKNKDSNEQFFFVNKPTIVTDEFLAEMVCNRKDPPEYLVYNFKSDGFDRKAQIDLGETDKKGRQIIYVPPFNDSLKKGLVIVPSDATETTFKEVFEEIDKFATSSYDPCGQDALVKLLTRISVGSWFMDRFVADQMFDIAGSGKFAPIIPIRGPSQSGKNRLAFVLRMLSYRPYFEMSTYRIPSLFRPLDLWQGTLVLDEADFANTNEKSELVHFLNCRATGTPLSRQSPNNPSNTDTFNNFGLTILTQRRPFDDNATESRAIPYYSETSDKRLPVVETDEMLKQGLELQNKLLFLRMKFYKQVTINKEAWINDLTDHRLVASLLPLLALSNHEPSLREIITKTAKEVEKAKVEEKANSMDGLIINFLWEKINETLFENWRPNIFYILKNKEIETNNEIETEHKTALTTNDLADQFKWSPQSIRKALGSLGIVEKGLPTQVKVDGHNARVIFFDPRRIEKRLREFVVNYSPNKVTEVTGVTDLTCDIPDSPLFAFSRKDDILHKKTVTPVTSVTPPFLPDFEDKCGPPNSEEVST